MTTAVVAPTFTEVTGCIESEPGGVPLVSTAPPPVGTTCLVRRAERHVDRGRRRVHEHAALREVAAVDAAALHRGDVGRGRARRRAEIDGPLGVPLERPLREVVEVRVVTFHEQVVAEVVHARRDVARAREIILEDHDAVERGELEELVRRRLPVAHREAPARESLREDARGQRVVGRVPARDERAGVRNQGNSLRREIGVELRHPSLPSLDPRRVSELRERRVVRRRPREPRILARSAAAALALEERGRRRVEHDAVVVAGLHLRFERLLPILRERGHRDVHEELCVGAARHAFVLRVVPEPRLVRRDRRVVVSPVLPVDDELSARRRLPHAEVVVEHEEIRVERAELLRDREELLLGADVVARRELHLRGVHRRQLIDEERDRRVRVGVGATRAAFVRGNDDVARRAVARRCVGSRAVGAARGGRPAREDERDEREAPHRNAGIVFLRPSRTLTLGSYPMSSRAASIDASESRTSPTRDGSVLGRRPSCRPLRR